MRLFWFIFCTGLLIFYFVDKAVKVDSFTLEALLNNLYHFFAGFVFLTWMYYVKVQHKFRWSAILFIGILVLDEVYDFSRGIKDTSFLTIFLIHTYWFGEVLVGLSLVKNVLALINSRTLDTSRTGQRRILS